MVSATESVSGVLRRTILKASAITTGALAVGTPAVAGEEDEDENGEHDDDGDHEGFQVEILGEHATFPDDVAATFELTFADGQDDESIDIEMDDPSSVIVAEVTWEPGARSGWHQHPGMAIVHMVEGEIEFTMADDCVSRTYAAGDAWIDPGAVHTADSEDGARAYVIFLDIPEGEPATESIPAEDVGC
ncbi:cupin domain-containing protein [Halopiger djelfimassiliensis]|uniref:cupin domain-containing protein n=1 Tax=Halopiger djelfimassiliensis TaxID=1293047 RepID=UPI000677EBA0|nr:cupin domain-containing protein [Halopiger djelfimassiliensis]